MSLRRGLVVAEPAVERVEQGLGGFRDHGAGREDRLCAGALELVVVLRRHHAANHDHDVVAAFLRQRRLKLGYEREVRRRERGDAEHVHVVLDRLARGFRGRREQRSDIDIEAEIGEGGGDHLLPAVVAVLADLGDEDAWPPPFVGLERGDQALHARNRFRHGADLPFVDAGDRLDLRPVAPEHLFQRR